MISIVTVNYNDYDGLKNTVDSVFEQVIDRKKYQFIVIDGGSSDLSPSVLSEYDLDYAISEPDDGIFNAMNKGLSQATGDHVIFLNAGDVFFDRYVLSKIYDVSKEVDVNTLVFGRAQISSDKGWSYPPSKIKSSNVLNWLKSKQPHHQATLFPYNFYMNNIYDESLRIAGDIDYKLKAISSCYIFFYDLKISIFDYNGVSNDLSTYRKMKTVFDELNIVYKRHGFGYFFRIKLFFKYSLKCFFNKIGAEVLFKLLSRWYK